jgi:hypothetical protein
MPIAPTFPRTLSAALQRGAGQRPALLRATGQRAVSFDSSLCELLIALIALAYYIAFPRQLFERFLVLKPLSFSFAVQAGL